MAKPPSPAADGKKPAQVSSFPLMPAIERLDAAIARLESAVDTHAKRTLEERESLNATLQDLRNNHVALQAEARNVAARLDAVIGRLKSVADEA
jgi:hypothetical protein